MSADEDATSRIERLIGPEGVEALAAATVMVIGIGGVGSNCAEALARGGVGHFILVDHDVVEPSNLNRQAVAWQHSLGQKKTEVMRDMIADINPAATVEVVDTFVLEDNVDAIVRDYALRADYVVDAIDTVSTKLALAQAAQEHGFWLVSAMGGGNKLHPELLRFADINDTFNCRMSRIMRKECRKRGIRRLRVLFSTEEARAATTPKGQERGQRGGLGTMPYFPPIMGQMIAGEVIRTIVGLER